MKLRLTLADTSLVSSLLQYSSSTSSSTQVVSTSSLQAYYKLDGNSSDTAGTSTGSDVSITYATTSGKINTGASFTTSGSSYISLGTQPALACPSFCSISAWVNIADTTKFTTILGDRGSSGTWGQMNLVVSGNTSTKLAFVWGNG